MTHAVDAQGYRPNVGMIICNHDNQLLWAKRTGTNAWQFPQGGIRPGESLEEAMYRELNEEVGLEPDDVELLGQTEEWVHYKFGGEKTTSAGEPYIGQKQIWFLLRFLSEDKYIKLDQSEHSEFDEWRWVDFWYPLKHIVDFKKPVYEKTLHYFEPILLAKRIRF